MPDPHALPLTPDVAGWLAARQRAKDKVRQWQATADAAQEKVVAALEEAGMSIGTIDGKPACKWVTVESAKVDVSRLRAELPDVADAYSTVITSHRFTIPSTRPTS